MSELQLFLEGSRLVGKVPVSPEKCAFKCLTDNRFIERIEPCRSWRKSPTSRPSSRSPLTLRKPPSDSPKRSPSCGLRVARLRGQRRRPPDGARAAQGAARRHAAHGLRRVLGETAERQERCRRREPKKPRRGHGPKSQPDLPIEEVTHTLARRGPHLLDLRRGPGRDGRPGRGVRGDHRRRGRVQDPQAPAAEVPLPVQRAGDDGAGPGEAHPGRPLLRRLRGAGGRGQVPRPPAARAPGAGDGPGRPATSTARRCGIRSRRWRDISSRPTRRCAGRCWKPTWSTPTRPSGATTRTRTPASGGPGAWRRTTSPPTAS